MLIFILVIIAKPMIKQLQTTRTCTVCGQKKPLVAFLELAGEKGHTYGDICATCRSAGRGRKKAGEEAAGQSGGTTRLQIDSKTKVQQDLDKKEQAKESVEQDYEEKLKKENAEAEETSESEQREEAEKKYREEYLERRKQGPATTDKTNVPATKENQATQAQGFYQEKARVTKEFHQQASDQQLGKKTSGLTPEYINKYVSATGRSAESLFGQFLGQFMRNHLQTQAKTAPAGAAQQKTKAAAPVTGKGKTQETGKPEQQENNATEFVRNNFKKR